MFIPVCWTETDIISAKESGRAREMATVTHSVQTVHSACKRNLITSERINIIELHYFSTNPHSTPLPTTRPLNWPKSEAFPVVSSKK